jgi:secreted trypsin-like serine protease
VRATQLGIASRGRSCGDFNAPVIYTSDEFSFSLISSIVKVNKGGEVRATQLGIVSRGRSCGDFNAPGIYTRDEFSFSLFNSILIIKYFFLT